MSEDVDRVLVLMRQVEIEIGKLKRADELWAEQNARLVRALWCAARQAGGALKIPMGIVQSAPDWPSISIVRDLEGNNIIITSGADSAPPGLRPN